MESVIPTSLFESVRETLRVQASTPVEITRVETIERSSLSDVEIIAAVGMNSSLYSGTLAICFPKETFLKVVNQMLGEKYTEITVENSDAAGELMNIIYASARVKINQAGNDFGPALPTTTRGPHIQISHGGSNKIVRATCGTAYGTFYFEISFRRKSEQSAA